jgi:protein gp37
MTTVEQADYLWRIDAILGTPAVVHAISAEPILGAMNLPRPFLHLGARAWVIAGGESGPDARPATD